MKRFWLLAAACAVWSYASWAAAASTTLINDTTLGRYNQGIGTSLNGTSSAFPTSTDPILTFSSAPDLTAAAAALGNWLTSPASPGGTWTGLQVIPSTWAVTTETAIIYSINAATGLSNVVVSIGVDNGIFAWMDGSFLGGSMAPGGVVPGEFMVTVPTLATGTHFLQLLREDHGGDTGFTILVSAPVLTAPVPEPGTLALLAAGLLGVATRRRLLGRY